MEFHACETSNVETPQTHYRLIICQFIIKLHKTS